MILQVALAVTLIKILFIPLYRSTDFEVHRNWLAITHSLPKDKWYYENTSEWTLDYPPLFAWFEYALSQIAKWFDPLMLQVTNLNYASDKTILFQRLSVILLDVIYFLGVKSCMKLIGPGKLLVFILMVSSPGLLMVDHIHFQYNGFLYGIMLLSLSYAIQDQFMLSAFLFAVLLNLKHIYLYIAPAYVVYMLRAYCFTVVSRDGLATAWYSFSIANLLKLGLVVTIVFGVSFGPFIQHIPQILSRLFPFKRGLCHSYWAPNFWALYNFADKALQIILLKFNIAVSTSEAAMTGGLVQEYSHSVLPSVPPAATFVLTAAGMAPALLQLWRLGADRKYRGVNFIRCVVLCATSAFMFGWHVHEKAILMILIPISFLAVLGEDDARLFLVASAAGHYSLFPLLYPKNLTTIKLFMLLAHCGFAFSGLPTMYEKHPVRKYRKRRVGLPMLSCLESFYVYGLLVVFLYENVLHAFLGLEKRLPFLPLMFTSVYCGVGILYFFVAYYHYFLTFNLSAPYYDKTSTRFTKKVR